MVGLMLLGFAVVDTITNAITWFDITKDIVIPGLGVIATVVIGIVIAVILKKREERVKKKNLLIENYMEYLNKRDGFIYSNAYYFIKQILRDIVNNYSDYFKNHANTHLQINEIKKFLDILRDDDYSYQKRFIWTHYISKFSFLIGQNTYTKHLSKFENDLNRFLLSHDSMDELFLKLKRTIINDKDIQDNMNSSKISEIQNGIDMIGKKIISNVTNYYHQYFLPYDRKLSQLIDNY